MILLIKVWTLFGQFLSKWTLFSVQYVKKQERPLISDFQVTKVEKSTTSLYSSEEWFFIMTEKEFWDMFHKKHNPDYYYGKNTQKKETQKKKNDRKRYAVKRYPVFKVQD